MKYLSLFILTLLTSTWSLASKPSIAPDSVAILYNSKSVESKELAEYYAKARNIPAENMIGLATSEKGKITRAEYVTTIQDPLRKHFTDKGWWKLVKTREGYTVSSENKIKVLVTMRGIPYGVNQDPSIVIPAEVKANTQIAPFTKWNCASVDSELTVLSIQGIPTYLPIENKYFKKDISFSKAAIPFYMLVGRIDAEKLETCKRMIDDAIAVEKTGLRGMCYLDQAKKGKGYEIGDDWIKTIEARSWSEGIPTTIENTKDNYLTNYPMKDAALYFGWHTPQRNGPLLNPNFRFRKGAVAIHLHSYSASNLRKSQANWTGPIMAAGAAATVGNVYEPYLGGSHHFDILYDRLLKGYTLIEAASMSITLYSWHNVVIGDPLYQPFKNSGSDSKIALTDKDDKFYQAVKIGLKAWMNDEDLLSRKFRTAAQKTKEGRYYEIIGLFKRYRLKNQEAALFFSSAEKLYLLDSDKTRMKLHIIDILREEGKKDQAFLAARMLNEEIKGTPEQKTVQSIMNILAPPAPPKAKPNKEIPK